MIRQKGWISFHGFPGRNGKLVTHVEKLLQRLLGLGELPDGREAWEPGFAEDGVTLVQVLIA